MMDYPNIARVLDAGTTETGRPFFVMELVRGIRITVPAKVINWCFTPDSRSFVTLDFEGTVSRWSGADFHERESGRDKRTNIPDSSSYAGSSFSATELTVVGQRWLRLASAADAEGGQSNQPPSGAST
jgi:hypothetical protein